MTLIDRYSATVTTLGDDINRVDTVLDRLDVALISTEVVLDLPDQFARYLRGRADAIDLPSVVVRALGGLPYGIGFAITQLNAVANRVENAIDAQASIMENLGDSWAPAQASVGALGDALIPISLGVEVLAANMENRTEEAALLAITMAGQEIDTSTELANRMTALIGRAEDWIALRESLISGVETSLIQIAAARDALEALMPSLPALQSGMNSALRVFDQAAEVAQGIYDALDITIDPPLLPAINLIDAISAITDFVSIVQNFIEGIVIGILEGLGFNTNVFSGVEDEIMDLLSPLFGPLAALEDRTADALANLAGLLGGLLDQVNGLFLAIGDAVGLETLFANDLAVLEPTGGSLSGTPEEDGLFGNLGADDLSAGRGDDFVFGGPGHDNLSGGRGADEMFGGTGDDTLQGGLGDDHHDGGPGMDTAVLNVALRDAQVTDAGDSLWITSAEGVDVFTGIEMFELAGILRSLDEMRAAASARMDSGTPADDTLTGTEGNDTLGGAFGNDSLTGLAGNDSLTGGAGFDTLRGGDGDDSLAGNTGSDSLSGGAGRDSLTGNAGFDTLNGGADDDTLSGGIGNDSLLGEAGNDSLAGNAGADTLTGGGENDSLSGNAGADSLLGDGGNDLLAGGINNDTLEGGSGFDTLEGGNGADSLTGGSGADSLSGNAGADTLEGGAGHDSLHGGIGADTFVLRSGDGQDLIEDFQNRIDRIALDQSLLSTATPQPADLADHAETDAAGNLVLRFGSDSLTLVGVSDLDQILDEVIFV